MIAPELLYANFDCKTMLVLFCLLLLIAYYLIY